MDHRKPRRGKRRIQKDPRPRIEAVEILGRIEKVCVEAGLRRHDQFRCRLVGGVEFERVILCLIMRREFRIDYPQIARLHIALIRIEPRRPSVSGARSGIRATITEHWIKNAPILAQINEWQT